MNDERKFIHDILNYLTVVDGKLSRICRKLDNPSESPDLEYIKDAAKKAKDASSQIISIAQERRTNLEKQAA